jgi:hypothetical protein
MDWGIEKWPTIKPWKKPKSFAQFYASWERSKTVGDGRSLLQTEEQQNKEVAVKQAPDSCFETQRGCRG